jgi:hypothetical protein
MIGYTTINKRLQVLQVVSGTVRYNQTAISGTFTLWRPGWMAVVQGGMTVSKPYSPYKVNWNLKKGMARPIVWGCPVEMTDFVERLVFQILDVEKQDLVPKKGLLRCHTF